ncbi:hypothetical protein [Occultella gossypii]|uniref:Uncharacterized protein n=1 Tax=Occultella gossypii TaxID=2800820 RepID=A0ABS7SA83_9MICO|nr:hypothetical protein [Occultella gossypii]MBZ2197256.1 hypothetical protein [Occultella gossypii]
MSARPAQRTAMLRAWWVHDTLQTARRMIGEPDPAWQIAARQNRADLEDVLAGQQDRHVRHGEVT